ncbi:MAG: 4Fe-4S binding protein [Promethearchaeota archaeon]
MPRPGAMEGEILGTVLRRKTATIRYPFQEAVRPERLRGQIEYDLEKCTGCGLCSRECPATAIEMVASTKTKTQKKPQFRFDRCIWCGTCEAVCPKKAITMTPKFEMAAFSLKDEHLFVVSEDPEPAESKE